MILVLVLVALVVVLVALVVVVVALVVVVVVVAVTTTTQPLLVLAPGTCRIDKSALERAMGCRVRLATPAEAEAATGHVVGTIPPLCVDACGTLTVLMDTSTTLPRHFHDTSMTLP